MSFLDVTLPATYPPQPNAPIEIKFTVHSRAQDTTVRFNPTIMTNETWVCKTTLSGWPTDFEPFLSTVWNYIVTARASNWTFDLRYALTIKNVTAPTPPDGAWVQAKEHFDGMLTDGDVGPDTTIITQTVAAVIDNLTKMAKY